MVNTCHVQNVQRTSVVDKLLIHLIPISNGWQYFSSIIDMRLFATIWKVSICWRFWTEQTKPPSDVFISGSDDSSRNRGWSTLLLMTETGCNAFEKHKKQFGKALKKLCALYFKCTHWRLSTKTYNGIKNIKIVFSKYKQINVGMADLKPIHPMQLRWAPRLCRPRAMMFGQVVHFCQIHLALENSVETAYEYHCWQTIIINIIVGKQLS